MAKQQELGGGVGRKQIPEIEDAAEKLRELRAKRQELAEQEEKAQAELRDLLIKHGYRGKRRYIYEGEDGEGNPIKLDALLEKPEERAYVRKHKDAKAKAESNGEDKEEGESQD